jgi:GAF domain-containing protein/HAMP domain-containing protein
VFFGAVLVAVLTIGTSRSIMRRLADLVQVTEQLAAGEYHTRAKVERQDEIGTLGQAYNTMAGELQTTLTSLEQRALQIETSAEVSRRLSMIMDQEELVRQVVEQVQSTFDYYHAHIYLYDDDKENLIMVGGTGEAGRQMLGSGHSIPTGKGLVGRAAESNEAILTPDVSQAIGWLPNPLLPDTQAEATVPIAYGLDVLGVLDVQQDEVGGLDQADIDLLLAISSQVAVALQNARSFQEAQERATQEALIANISRQITGTTTVDDALKVAVRELGRALETETSVKMKTSSEGEMERQSTIASS